MRTERETKGQRSDMNLRAVRTRARSEAAENVESLWKDGLPVAQIDFSQPITLTEEEGNRNEGNEEAFSSAQAAIAVTEGEEMEPKTVKDAECQTTKFDYMFHRQADTDDKGRFYTGLPSMEMAVFEHVS